MVDTNDEWIMTRVGIKERRILTEEGLGTSYMARKAAKQLMQKTGVDPDTIDAVIVTTSTADYKFPSTASIVLGKLGLKNAFAFDFWAACCGFLYTLDVAASMIQCGRYKKIIVIGADKMSSVVDYKDRATCPLFGDGAAAVLVEGTEEENIGVMDSYFRADGKGLPFLHLKAGGSVCPPSYFTIDHRLHYLYQEGRTVFRYAVTNMSDDCALVAERNGLNKDNIQWVVPHQANMRIIEAVAKTPRTSYGSGDGQHRTLRQYFCRHYPLGTLGKRSQTEEGRQHDLHCLRCRIRSRSKLLQVGLRRREIIHVKTLTGAIEPKGSMAPVGFFIN